LDISTEDEVNITWYSKFLKVRIIEEALELVARTGNIRMASHIFLLVIIHYVQQ
jgi:hypothetical protein